MQADTLAQSAEGGALLQAGRKLGNYQVVRQLGQGGMGSVFEAVHQYIERSAAIKVLHPDLSQNPQFKTRFLNEARAVNLIKHPGLVEIFEFGLLEDGTAYIIMEYLEGESLAKRLQRAPNGLGDEALVATRQIAQAMTAVHQKDIVHRDLKPDNVMLIPDPERPGQERVKVLDFGIAKLSSTPEGAARTETGTMIGTPAYMAPEQCLGASSIDGKADVYALGVMLYEMLTGALPFVAQHSFDFMAAHVREAPQPLSQLRPDIPSEIADLVHSMLLKDPLERPTMAAVVTLIDQILGAGLSVGRSTPPGLRPSRDALPRISTPSGQRAGSAPTDRELALGATTPGRMSSKPGVSKEQLELGPTVAGLPRPGARLSRDAIDLGALASNPSGQSSRPRDSGSVPPSATSEPAPAAAPPVRSPLLLVLGGVLLLAGLVVVALLLRQPRSTAQPTAQQRAAGSERKVKWVVISKPAGAEIVRSDGHVLGSTPWHIERPADPGETVVTLRAPGFQDKRLLLSHATDVSTEVPLSPVPPPAPAADAAPPESKDAATPSAKAQKAKPGARAGKKKKDQDVKLLID